MSREFDFDAPSEGAWDEITEEVVEEKIEEINTNFTKNEKIKKLIEKPPDPTKEVQKVDKESNKELNQKFDELIQKIEHLEAKVSNIKVDVPLEQKTEQLGPKSQKAFNNLVSSANKLNKNLKEISYDLQGFNAFQNRIKNFGFWKSTRLIIISFLVGVIMSVYVQSELVSYYIKSENSKYLAASEQVDLLKKYGFLIDEDEDSVRVGIRNKDGVSTYETEQYQVIKIRK